MSCVENPAYLREQLITYLGNKRALLGFIGEALSQVKRRLGRRKLRMFDLFSGSGVVSRLFKAHAELLVSNDLEAYAELINRCYLANVDELDLKELEAAHIELCSGLKDELLQPGIIARHYAPADDTAIRPGERVFYTTRNARYLDTARRRIGTLPERLQPYFLAPLLSEASVHANTAGVFKGFYKDARTGVGRFGGSNSDALSRITAPIDLPFPLWSRFSCELDLRRGDAAAEAAAVATKHGTLDIAYLDPPYNQHPYGSNYFLLNLLVDYREPEHMSRVSGIPTDWQRSAFNRRADALGELRRVIEALDARFLLVSFNSEGFVSHEEMQSLLRSFGRLEVMQTDYNTFRGSRNLRSRSIHLTEYLYLLERT